MVLRKCFFMACLVLVQGCAVPRFVTVHDGLNATIIDSVTREPIPDAFVFAKIDKNGNPIILSRSDSNGHLHLEPKKKLQIVPIPGEALVWLTLSVCKEGYKSKEILSRGGWNADYQPAQVHDIGFVELIKKTSLASSGCRNRK